MTSVEVEELIKESISEMERGRQETSNNIFENYFENYRRWVERGIKG
jgi:hypothetical protein